MDQAQKNKFIVLAIPRSRGFVVSREKAEEFKNSTNSKKDNEQVLQMAEMFIKNNLVSTEEPKKRIRTKR